MFCFVLLNSQCILNVFTLVFLAVELSLEPPRWILPALNLPTQTVVKPICTQFKESLFPEYLSIKIILQYTDCSFVGRAELDEVGLSGKSGMNLGVEEVRLSVV